MPFFVSGRMYSIRVEKRMVIQSIYICENGSMRHEPGSPALSRGMFLFYTTLVWYDIFVTWLHLFLYLFILSLFLQPFHFRFSVVVFSLDLFANAVQQQQHSVKCSRYVLGRLANSSSSLSLSSLFIPQEGVSLLDPSNGRLGLVFVVVVVVVLVAADRP